jgi:GMP synthase (glutamine-hydrolysing)
MIEQGIHTNTVVILDAGAQYGMDIEQQLTRQGFTAVRMPFETPFKDIQDAAAIILSGGPESVDDPRSPLCDLELFSSAKRPPILGICYGAQLINYRLGGTVKTLPLREDGMTDITIDPSISIFKDLAKKQPVLMSHGDTVVKLAQGFKIIAQSGELVAGIANAGARIYGLQFHPEVSTKEGPTILRNFLTEVADLQPGQVQTVDDQVEAAVTKVKEQVGKRQVLAFVSGGVDSSALGALLKKALPAEQVFLVYIDSGLMRKGESQEVERMLAAAKTEVMVFDASEMFINGTTVINGKKTLPLHKVTDPETKRKIIGDTFIKVQDHMAQKLGLDLKTFMLAMGTLHTDLIESGSKHASAKADVIKSHHNDTEAVRRLRDQGRVVEPWILLQKDDVRAVASALGLPDVIAQRQPFPGPGLGIRILCAEEPYMPTDSKPIVKQLQKFDTAEIRTTLLPVRTVGVQGDHRTYGHLVALSGKQDWSALIKLASVIPRQIHGVNRVVYLFGEPLIMPVITEITPTFINAETISQLQEVDAIARDILKKAGLDKKLSQVPIISFPVSFGQPGKRSIGIRTFMTTNFKTGDIAVPGQDIPEVVLQEIVDKVLQVPGIARVVYDLTSKPPGTTEWE